MAETETHPPMVFISYSHDSREHVDRVCALSDHLRADGIDCILDQYEFSPPEGWPRWTETQLRIADFVLMICTETYYCRVMGDEKPDTGLGVRWEGHVIYQQIYNKGTINTKFIPVLLESSKTAHIPDPLQSATHYLVYKEDGYEDLYRHLTSQPRHLKRELGKVRALQPVQKLQPLEPKERKQDFSNAPLANLPFERNRFFTGREEILRALHDALVKTSAIALTQTQAISGLGGIGKTQTALEYAYRFADNYKATFWVRADSHLSLSTGFVEIARLLELPEKDAQNPDDTARAVLRWLESNDAWLLIFDNADQPEILKAFRPRNPKGHTLLTSRAQVFDTLGIARPVEMEAMQPGEALAFLFSRTGREDNNDNERNAATQLAEALGYLPLALDQAAAFIVAKKARFQDYLTSYSKRRLKLLKESMPVAGDYPESMATTWALNFSEVEKVSETSSDLLRLSAFLSPDNIPLELITKGRAELGPVLSTALAEVDDDPLLLNEVLEPLTRYSLIRLDNDSQTYNIHRLVQEVLKDDMDKDTQRLWAERTVSALNKAFPSVEFNLWPLCERLIPHAKAISQPIEEWEIIIEDAGRLLNQAALYSKERGQYADAESLYKRSLTIREKMQGSNKLGLATVLNNLGELYRVRGKYAEGETLHKRALAIREEVLSLDHTEIARSLNNLAALYYTQGKYTEAEPLFKRALDISEQALGADDPQVARNLNNLAELYSDQGKYAEAVTLQKRSLAIREKLLGAEHPDVAKSLNNLAALYCTQGNYTEVAALYERALTIYKETLGADHPSVGITLNNLAALYYLQDKYAEAEPLFKHSLAMREKALGPEHPDVAKLLKNYAVLLYTLRRDVEAAEMEARAKAIQAKHAEENSGEG
jgi:tetratricopeptide (TPR) repeat protein